MALSYVFAGVGGYYASKQGGLAGVFRCATDGTDWKHALSEIEAFTVFVHPRDPNLVFAGIVDGVYRSTDRGQNFRRADFPDRGVQVWSFLHDDADPKRMLAGGSPVSIYRSKDGGASWKRMPDPQLPIHAKMPFSCRVMRFAPHARCRGEIFAALEVSGVMRSTDGGESWNDCSADLLRLAEAELRRCRRFCANKKWARPHETAGAEVTRRIANRGAHHTRHRISAKRIGVLTVANPPPAFGAGQATASCTLANDLRERGCCHSCVRQLSKY